MIEQGDVADGRGLDVPPTRLGALQGFCGEHHIVDWSEERQPLDCIGRRELFQVLAQRTMVDDALCQVTDSECSQFTALMGSSQSDDGGYASRGVWVAYMSANNKAS